MKLDISLFQIIDEKSLIKKYQREISCLKEELDQLRRGMLVGVNPVELMTLKQQVTFQVTSCKVCLPLKVRNVCSTNYMLKDICAL